MTSRSSKPGWLKEMVSCFDYPQVGVVGAKLLYPDRTLQHVGVIAGLGGYAGHWHIGKPADDLGPQRRLAARQSLSVVTGACMLVSRACFERIDGFDEATFPIAYNDVDFCLRAGEANYRVVWTPFAMLVHHESASRGSDETPENQARFERDKAALRAAPSHGCSRGSRLQSLGRPGTLGPVACRPRRIAESAEVAKRRRPSLERALFASTDCAASGTPRAVALRRIDQAAFDKVDAVGDLARHAGLDEIGAPQSFEPRGVAGMAALRLDDSVGLQKRLIGPDVASMKRQAPQLVVQ